MSKCECSFKCIVCGAHATHTIRWSMAGLARYPQQNPAVYLGVVCAAHQADGIAQAGKTQGSANLETAPEQRACVRYIDLWN